MRLLIRFSEIIVEGFAASGFLDRVFPNQRPVFCGELHSYRQSFSWRPVASVIAVRVHFVGSLQKEVIERLNMSSPHHLRTFDLYADIVDRIGYSGNLDRACPNRIGMNIASASEHLTNVDNALDAPDFLRVFFEFGGRGRDDKRYLQREIGRFIVDFRMVAFDNAVFFELVNSVANSTGRDASRVANFLCCRIAGVPLKQIEDTPVHIVQVSAHLSNYGVGDTNLFGHSGRTLKCCVRGTLSMVPLLFVRTVQSSLWTEKSPPRKQTRISYCIRALYSARRFYQPQGRSVAR